MSSSEFGHSVKGSVLIVDDDEDIRETLTELVEWAGCSAVTAANGAEALKILSGQLPCLIILDMKMPVMNGEDFLNAVKLEPSYAEVPVVVSTSAPQFAPRDVPVIPKPIDVTRVYDLIHRTCRCGAASKPAAPGTT